MLPPPPREMPPLEVPATRRVTTRENMRLPDREGEVIFVSGRSRFADEKWDAESAENEAQGQIQ